MISFKRPCYTVHKFGGSSLVNARSFRVVASRLTGTHEIIVVSAIQGVTSKLQQLLELAELGQSVQSILDDIIEQHTLVITDLFASEKANDLLGRLALQAQELTELLTSVALVKGYSESVQSMVVGYGEQWSATILAALLAETHKALYLNATDVIFTQVRRGLTDIDWSRSKKALDDYFKGNSFQQLVVTGFLAADAKGKRITLGRNGSDFSAAIFAKLLQAEQLIIWKDVDGIFSADPSRVRSAFAIPELSYEAALELAYFGAKVIHPKTIAPAMELGIPIHIRNTLNPDAKGTLISASTPSSMTPVQGLTSIDQVALINIEGAGLIGVSGTAARVFQSLCQHHISVILISQASSEHSICFAVELKEADRAIEVLTETFEFEIQQQLINAISADKDCAILAVVGDGMVGAVGVSGRLMSTLAKSSINVRAIAQGSSERNISLVVAAQDIDRALRAVHAGFYLSEKTLSVGLIGPGLVGATLLDQINQQLSDLALMHDVKICVRGIANSKKMLLADEGIDLTSWKESLDASEKTSDLEAFAQYIHSEDIPHAVIIDCSASQFVADRYLDFIQMGLHVITPNKRTNAGDYDYYRKVKSSAAALGRHYLYETTVCAGLPVITTLHDVLKTGDRVFEISGIVSGTLSYIFSQLSTGQPFSQVILAAKEGGFTEPDPREDLSGLDVARKVVILARELGFETSLDDIDIVNLVPKALRSGKVDKFLQELPKFDDEIKAELYQSVKTGEQPVYVGRINQDGKVSVMIQSIAADHPFSRLNGTDNMLIFKTQRYCDQPLVIQGPGAGAEVTAAGVFADLLRLVAFI